MLFSIFFRFVLIHWSISMNIVDIWPVHWYCSQYSSQTLQNCIIVECYCKIVLDCFKTAPILLSTYYIGYFTLHSSTLKKSVLSLSEHYFLESLLNKMFFQSYPESFRKWNNILIRFFQFIYDSDLIWCIIPFLWCGL